MVQQVPAADGGRDDVSDALTRARREVRVAIALVAAGAARRVAFASLPDVERLAAESLALCQAAGVAFRLVRPDGQESPVIEIGPRLVG